MNVIRLSKVCSKLYSYKVYTLYLVLFLYFQNHVIEESSRLKVFSRQIICYDMIETNANWHIIISRSPHGCHHTRSLTHSGKTPQIEQMSYMMSRQDIWRANTYSAMRNGPGRPFRRQNKLGWPTP